MFTFLYFIRCVTKMCNGHAERCLKLRRRKETFGEQKSNFLIYTGFFVAFLITLNFLCLDSNLKVKLKIFFVVISTTLNFTMNPNSLNDAWWKQKLTTAKQEKLSV